MRYYQSNPVGGGGRCSTHGLMGPAILVTLGLLLLLANVADYPFERTWPILLIVIGTIRVIGYVIPESGHRHPGPYPPPSFQAASLTPYAAPAAGGPVVTPPPPSPAGAPGDGISENGEVHNG